MAEGIRPDARYAIAGNLPPRRSLRVRQQKAQKDTENFFEKVDRDDFDWVKTSEVAPAIRYRISQELDLSALRVYNTCVEKIQLQEKHKENYRVLAMARPNCGGFSLDTAILKEANPLEQMLALDHWIREKGPRWLKGRRTICLGAPGDEYIPIYIAKRRGINPTSMYVMLGAGKGDHKAPRYPELAGDAHLAETSVFKDPLDALEIVRQPYFASATILKAGAFAREQIDAQRRYEITDENKDTRSSQFACVELVNQNAPKNAHIKEHSSGTNLYSLVKHSPHDPINKDVLFEEFAHEGYNDDAEIEVTPMMLWDAAKASVCDKDSLELDSLMERIFISHVGKPSSPIVANFYAQRIFPPKEALV